MRRFVDSQGNSVLTGGQSIDITAARCVTCTGVMTRGIVCGSPRLGNRQNVGISAQIVAARARLRFRVCLGMWARSPFFIDERAYGPLLRCVVVLELAYAAIITARLRPWTRRWRRHLQVSRVPIIRGAKRRTIMTVACASCLHRQKSVRIRILASLSRNRVVFAATFRTSRS